MAYNHLTYNDETALPGGKYKDIPLKDVPDDYLLFIYENNYFDRHVGVRKYLEENIDAIKANIKNAKGRKV
jgi:uncharacterized protein (DUF3820 family)